MLRWIRRIAIAIAGLVLVAVAVLYGGSEWLIRRSQAVPLEKIAVPHDAASIAEGGRLARIEGCRDCHGREGEGRVFVDNAAVGRIVAPPFASVARRYSDAEIARAVRHGVRNDGTSLWVMPAYSHRYIADEDMGRIIAWLRTRQPGGKDVTQTTWFGPMARGLMLSGKIPAAVQLGDVAEAKRPADVGRYYYDTICAACHALDKPLPAHDGKGMAPALGPMADAYDLDAFRHLLKTGEGMSKRDLGLMKMMSQEAFNAMTPEEMAAVHAYLRGEPAKVAAR